MCRDQMEIEHFFPEVRPQNKKPFIISNPIVTHIVTMGNCKSNNVTEWRITCILLLNSCKTSGNTAKNEPKYPMIFLLVSLGPRVTMPHAKFIHKKMNCGCQELDPTYFTISFGGFLPHLVSFYHTWRILLPNPRNVRNTIIIANTNISMGRKILTLSVFVSPPKKKVPPPKCFNSNYLC